MNLAPLGDVLLVLLALGVTTLPRAQTPAVRPFQPRTVCPPRPGHTPPASRALHLDAAGGVYGNDRPLDDPSLQHALGQ
ncbi:biopolymer transporter ExbD, partial [Stenotrophomonas maltophilia]